MSQEGWRIENKAQLIRSINKINTQMNSQKLRQHAQGLHGFVLDMVLELKGGEDTRPLPNPEAISN